MKGFKTIGLALAVVLLVLGTILSPEVLAQWGGWGSHRSATASGASFPLLAPNGTAGAPSYSFSGETNTGLYSVGANEIGFTTAGILRLSVSDSKITATIPIWASNGSAASPSISFSGDINTGFYREGSDKFTVTTGGVEAASFAGQHIIHRGSTPTMGACGTSPSVVGRDEAMLITVGTGGSATTCAVTFITAFANAPVCHVQSDTDQTTFRMATTTGGLTITKATAFTASSKLHVICRGWE